MTRRTSFISVALCALLVSSSSAPASSRPCSIHAGKGAAAAELKSLAKISEAEARKRALASLGDPSKATVKEAELEAERGCLVYSFDIEVAGTKGVQEVQIDAGNGRVLSSEHESPKAEAAERARDKAKP